MSDRTERQPVSVVCSACGVPSRVLEGSIWAVTALCTACYVCQEMAAGREAQMVPYRAIFDPQRAG